VRRWIARARRADRRVVDRVFAAAFVVAGEIELLVGWDGGDGLLPLMAVVALAFSALAWRRRRPLLVCVALLGSWTFANLVLADVQPLQLPLVATLVASYAAGAYTSGREALAAPFLLLVGMTFVTGTFEDQVFTDFVFPTAFSLIAWLAGRGVRTRTRLTEELHEASVQAQEAHEHEVARAAADERRRIARCTTWSRTRCP
jgi:signal transduction histidine kinase